MVRYLIKLLHCGRGATAVEYGLMLGLMTIVFIAGIAALGGSTSGKWGGIANKVSAVMP